LSTVDSPAAGSKTWFYGTGRRKESIARVFIRPGSGKFTVNGRTAEQYFPNHAWLHDATEPLKFTSLAEQVDVVATAKGGGVGDSRARCAWDSPARSAALIPSFVLRFARTDF